MLTLKKKPAAQRDSAEAKGPAQAASWTNGSALGSKAVSAIVVVGWLCAPLALGVAFLKPSAAPQAVVAAAEDQLTPLQQSAGSYAVGFVGSWLSASKDDATALNSYLSTAPAALGDQAYDSRNLVVAHIVASDEHDLVTVTIGADIYEQPDEESPPTWIRRYFEVSVSTADGSLVARGMPSPVAGPKTGTVQRGTEFSNQLVMSTPAAETVNLFLTAYLTGEGSTSSYLTPGVSITPISPAPYTQLTPSTQYSDVTPAESPADGDLLQVEATVTVANANSQSVSATYWVHLTARSDRWEVTELTAVNSGTETTQQIAPTPSPTNTSEGDPE